MSRKMTLDTKDEKGLSTSKFQNYHTMKYLLTVLSVAVLGLFGTAYAQPLDDIDASVLESDGYLASVHLAWNHDDSISVYEVGCVSCIPNFSENTSGDEIILSDVTSLENGIIVLYIIAYHDNSEMVTVKQVLLNLP